MLLCVRVRIVENQVYKVDTLRTNYFIRDKCILYGTPFSVEHSATFRLLLTSECEWVEKAINSRLSVVVLCLRVFSFISWVKVS